MTLAWRKVDEYHIRSNCGRFSVARITVASKIWYVAFRLPFGESQPSTEIGATSLPATATEAERKTAIRDMKQICEAAA